jgi:hypothetical protein
MDLSSGIDVNGEVKNSCPYRQSNRRLPARNFRLRPADLAVSANPFNISCTPF